jgi:hypothetical protein
MRNGFNFGLGMSAAVVCVAMVSPMQARAQETISDQVWLGSTLFTIEDLENLTDAAKLTQDQQDAALELMRGGMARARTMALRTYRGNDDFDWSDGEDQEKKMKEWKERLEKQRREVVEVEKSVMEDLKSLLEPAQADEGWAKYERSRRRLLLRSVDQVQQQAAQMQNSGASMHYYGGWGQESVPDLVATIRASKLTKEDVESIGLIMEQYATSMDALIKDYRSGAKLLLKGQQGYWGGWSEDSEAEKPSEGDLTKVMDSIKRMKETHVRHAQQVDNTLAGDAKDRFMRQRLRAEFKWQWTPSKRLPQLKAILKLKSLTKEQREEVTAMIKKADEELMRLAAEGLRAQDTARLKGDDGEQKNPWEQMQGEEAQDRAKKEAKVRKDLIKDAVALLDDAQKMAYETGIESEQDLANAFEKRRHGTEAWGLDQDIAGWDWDEQRGEDEEEQK